MKRITELAVYCRKGVARAVLFAFCIIPALPAVSMVIPQKATRQTALAAFEKNDFELALKQFTELSATYPKDPLYKYYCGVCLIRLERDLSRSVTLLNEAVNGSAAIRTVPDDGLFWLGRGQQMTGNFSDAVKSYEKFSSLAGKKTSKEMNVPDYIKQCQDKKGMIKETAAVVAEKPDLPAEVKKEVVPLRDTVQTTGSVLIKPENPSPEYDKLMAGALANQKSADSISAVSSGLKAQLSVATGASRNDLKANVQSLDKLALEKQKLADEMMKDAQKLNDSVPDIDDKKIQEPVAEMAAVKDTVPAPLQPAAAPAIAVVKEKEVFSEFEVVEKPVYQANEKVTVNPDVAPGLIYRIQVAVFRNPVAPSYFKGMKPVQGFKNDANGITTYYAGMFRRSADASQALQKVRTLGFKDSFVAALMDKKAVSPDRAAVLEKEWGQKPLYTVKQAAPDTVPKTLVFRVEVKRALKPLPAEQVENFKKMAGTRGFDILVTEKKESVYLIGTFLTFKSASEFTDLLIRNGLRDSKVVAYLGNREIPVETAKQLFDEHE